MIRTWQPSLLFWSVFRSGILFALVVHAALTGNGQFDTLARSAPAPHGKAVKWVLPAALTGVGIYAAIDHSIIDRYGIRNWRNHNFADFRTRADDGLAFLPVAAAYALNLCGIKSKHDFLNRTMILFKSEAMMLVLVHSLKSLTGVERPDGSDRQAFPSGHTAQAFLAANFLHHEYGSRNTWYSIAGYTLAAGVGAFRILNNKHWVSDVMAGAGIGLLCSELAYHTHRYRWGKKGTWTVWPYWERGRAGCTTLIRL